MSVRLTVHRLIQLRRHISDLALKKQSLLMLVSNIHIGETGKTVGNKLHTWLPRVFTDQANWLHWHNRKPQPAASWTGALKLIQGLAKVL
jgi:hypothetical protein